MEKQIKKYYILTYGCQMNISDSERIEAVLNNIGWEKTYAESEADLIVVNACAVRQSAMDRIHGKTKAWNKARQKRNLKLLLTGCLLDADKKKMAPMFDYILSIKELNLLPKYLGYDKADFDEYFDVKPSYNSKATAYIPIMTGCDKYCTYCAVPYTRGREVSRPYGDILKEVEALIEKGYKEIMLLGQNVNSYIGHETEFVNSHDAMNLGKRIVKFKNADFVATKGESIEGKINFPQLLQMVCDIKGDFWVSFLTSHPYDMSDDLIDVMANNEKIGKYLNFPVQSGDNNVLKRMNRHYSVELYLDRVKCLKKKIPDIVICTDIIVGFCGETEEEFENTGKLISDVQYDIAYLSKYSPRVGTYAEKNYKDDISNEIKKQREKNLNILVGEIGLKKNKKFIGRKVEVLVEKVKHQKDSTFLNTGKTQQFKTVRFVSDRSFVGEKVMVEIIDVIAWGLEGKLI